MVAPPVSVQRRPARSSTARFPRRLGRVLVLGRWPVWPLGGELVAQSLVDERGLAGDHRFALRDVRADRGQPVDVAELPAATRWSARYDRPLVDPAAPPIPVLCDPGGTGWRWNDPRLPGLLAADIGATVALGSAPAGSDPDATIVITTAASHLMVEQAVGERVELDRWRPNLHLAVNVPAFAEAAWVGRRLQAGGVTLRITGRHPHHPLTALDSTGPPSRGRQVVEWLSREHAGIFGVRAGVEEPGKVAVGDTVVLLA